MFAIFRRRMSGMARLGFRCTVGLLLGGSAALSLAAVLPHWKIQGYGPNLGPINSTWQPYLNVSSGCVPYPAVDDAGNVSGGLQNSGSRNGGCSHSDGQVYVRQGHYGGQCAIMYAWFFPKDQNVDGPGNLGHRYDWEDIVVWTQNCQPNDRINQISYSQHGEYEKIPSNRPGGLQLNGTHPKVNYGQHGTWKDHDVSPTNETGGQQPGIDWKTISPAARRALNGFPFGKAVVPFKDTEFVKNLAKAF